MPKIPNNLYIIHFALMLAPALFAAAIFFGVVQNDEAAVGKDATTIFQSVAAVLAVIAVGFAQIIPRFIIRGEKRIPLQKYISLKIAQWALVEGAAFFIAVVYYLSRQKSLLIPTGVLIAILAIMRPTNDEIVRYNVTDE